MAAFGTAGTVFGGLAIDRETFRVLLPDARWVIYAAGLVNPNDANTATIALVYQKDDGAYVTLGTPITQAGSGLVKREIPAVDLFGTAGVPSNERIPVIRLRATKSAGVDGEVFTWTIWLQLRPARQ